MLRRSHILTTAALLAVCATPASAATYEELRSNGSVPSGDVAPPPSLIAASADDGYQDLRSPDAKDAAREAELQLPTPVVEVKGSPTSGFDWGDAGIGAAGTLALFSIAAGSALLLTARRRRQGIEVAH